MKLSITTAVAFLWSVPAFALSVTTTDDAATLAAAAWVDTGAVTVTSATYAGASDAAGTYSDGPLGIADGVIITSGQAELALPPDSSGGTGFSQGLSGDSLCDDLIPGYTSFDAARLTLTFDLAENFDGISFQFVFGSEEYPEYVGTSYNDVLGVYLTDSDGVQTQVAFDVDGNAISINGPFFSSSDVVLAADNGTEYDGSTDLLTTQATLTGNTSGNTLDIVVCDGGDTVLDSGVFFTGLSGCVGADCSGTLPCDYIDDDGDGVDSCTDCDDTDPNTYPGAEEICDDLDNDCDTEIDEGGVCDTDGDGIPDVDDDCLDTAEGDIIDEYGCAISDYCPCDADIDGSAWKNHGKYVSCVAHLANDFADLGLIDVTDKGDIISDAGSSDCGKTGGKAVSSDVDGGGTSGFGSRSAGCSSVNALPLSLGWIALSGLGLVAFRRRD